MSEKEVKEELTSLVGSGTPEKVTVRANVNWGSMSVGEVKTLVKDPDVKGNIESGILSIVES